LLPTKPHGSLVPMRLKKGMIPQLATKVVTSLITKQLLQPKTETNALIELVSGVFLKNVEDEAKIEDETHKLMEQYQDQMNQDNADTQRMYMMIKKEVAKKRKFTL
jgi:hypothetical protein